MRDGTGRGILKRGMESTTITLRIVLVGESPTGCATDADGSTRDFAGWLGLVAAIDGMLSDAPPENSTMEETVR